MKEYKTAVFIGRFQPFHVEHLAALKRAYEIADQVLIVIGSYRIAPSIKNPFNFFDRAAMIEYCLKAEELNRTQFLSVRDHYYNDNLWVAEVQQKTSKYIKPGDSVALIGAYKDSSSYYINLFPQWEFVASRQTKFLDASHIRECWYKRTQKPGDFNFYHADTTYKGIIDDSWQKEVPEGVLDLLLKRYFHTEAYTKHVQDWWFFEEYKKKWGAGPFITTDAVVVCCGHVLIVKRKFSPGKDLLALPGGFMKLNERLEDGALRELKEETGIDIDKPVLRRQITSSKVFDYPGRSLRGRTITHAYHIPLQGSQLPRVFGNDDAAEASWMPISDIYLNEDKFFEDHFHIINHFITRG